MTDKASSGGKGAAAAVRALAAEVPGSLIAAMGIALSIYLYELTRMSSFQVVTQSSRLAVVSGALVTATALALGAAYMRRPRLRMHRHTWLILAVATVFMATVLITLNASLITVDATLSGALRLLSRILSLLLLVFWMEPALGLSARNAATLFSASLILLGVFNLFTCFLREASSSLVVAMFPLISMMCLCWFKDRMEVFYGTAAEREGGAGTPFGADATLIPAEGAHRGVVSFLYFMQPLVLCPIGYGFVHFAWVPAQDGASSSMYIQVASAIGTILGGVLVLVLVAWFWGRRKLALYNLFTLLVLLFTMSLVNMPGATAPYPYVVFLNIAQKITFFFVLMTPFLIRGKSSPLTVWCLGFALYQTGKTVSNAMSHWLDPAPYHMAVSLCVLVSAVCIVVGIVVDQGKHAFSEERREASPTPTPAGPLPDGNDGARAVAQPETGAPSTAQPLASVCHEVARSLMLTRREEDVLLLAAQKKAAHEIAEELVIGDSTAKTHLRNLYVKLGVHSKAELLGFLENYRSTSR